MESGANETYIVSKNPSDKTVVKWKDYVIEMNNAKIRHSDW